VSRGGLEAGLQAEDQGDVGAQSLASGQAELGLGEAIGGDGEDRPITELLDQERQAGRKIGAERRAMVEPGEAHVHRPIDRHPQGAERARRRAPGERRRQQSKADQRGANGAHVTAG
jgi:hypothetical protein